MLARLERRDRHPPVIRDRRVDMHEIDIPVGEHVFVTFVASIDAECVSHRVQRDLRSAADRVHVRLRIAFVDRDELHAEPQTDDRDINLLCAVTHDLTLRYGLVTVGGRAPAKKALLR
jgi:hypothetical protein